MRRNMKKLCCAILCICLLLINTPYSMSYAENMEQNASETDAETDTTTEDVDVPEAEASAQAVIGTDEAEIDAESATVTDALLYAASENEYSIHSQEDWDNLPTAYPDGFTDEKITLYTDITLSEKTTLSINTGKLTFCGDGEHSINLNGKTLSLEIKNPNVSKDAVEINNITFKNGTVHVIDSNGFSCNNSTFSAASLDLRSFNLKETTITGCKFLNCPNNKPCIYSNYAPCPVTFSDCYMNGCGLLFASNYKCDVTFSNIMAENCTGTVFGNTTNTSNKTDSYTIKSISGCELSTSTPGLTAIDYYGIENSTVTSFSSASYDIDAMSQIYDCTITGFDTGINLNQCDIVVKKCKILDCKDGIKITGYSVAIVDTELTGDSTGTGITSDSNAQCYLIDCDINGFDIGSDMKNSNTTTIIGCRYENRDTNLIGGSLISAYDTSFIGGETSVIINNASYFYDCIVKGDAATTKSGFSTGSSGSKLYIYSLNRPYDRPYDVYDNLKNHSNRTNGKSEIFNCETGIDYGSVYIADTHIHDCDTGIQAYSTYFYGNNLIEKCTDGMIVDSLRKDGINTTFTDTHVDTICNCLNNGLDGRYITFNPSEWKNRLEIYDCGNYGIKVNGGTGTEIMMAPATVEVHDCEIGIYITDNVGTINLKPETKIYDNQKWNIYDDSTNATRTLEISGSEGTLKGGGEGNVSSKKEVTFVGGDGLDFTLNSDDSVYYLGTKDVMFKFNVNKLDGTVVFDTVDDGYTSGRKVAELDTDITSQMFAKKEGYIIRYQEDNDKKYAVFAEGYDVTYDVTANGGDTFIAEDNVEEIKDGKSKRISYLKGDTVNLNYKASKPGYTFVGWNTDEDATEGLEPDTLKAETADITLYAIYEKTADINYHTYDADLDYSTDVTFYNNEDEIECELAAYNADGDKNFAGYVLNENAVVSSADDLLKAGDNVTVSPDGLDVYCVYSKQGQLKYLKKDGSTLSTESKTVYEIGSDNKKFVYTVRAGEPVEGFTFTGWKDAAGKSYAAGATLSTEDNLIVLTPVYVENAEPTPEVPTPEVPTPEVPTPEVPTPEVPTPEVPTPGDPVIQPPTTEASTTQAPAGPKTGDSTNPIGVIGLGILSLLGILILTMKNKRKN